MCSLHPSPFTLSAVVCLEFGSVWVYVCEYEYVRGVCVLSIYNFAQNVSSLLDGVQGSTREMQHTVVWRIGHSRCKSPLHAVRTQHILIVHTDVLLSL